MRASIQSFMTLGFLGLSGCAGTNWATLAPNTIDEPVFHRATNISLGASRTQWYDPASGKDSAEEAIKLNARADVPVNEWAGFSFLPVYWNFLLTGEQYQDSIHLMPEKLNIAMGGGLAGISFSSRDGWKFPIAIGAQAKYLFDRRFFAKSVISTEITDASDPENGQTWGLLGLGAQLTNQIAVVATTNLDRVFAAPNSYFNMYGVSVLDGELTSTSGLTLDWYPTPKHVLSVSVDRFFRTDTPSNSSRWLFSAQYNYVFCGRCLLPSR